jgi:hypothetical protein
MMIKLHNTQSEIIVTLTVVWFPRKFVGNDELMVWTEVE